MIAYDPRGTPQNPRVLSPALTERLREAIARRWEASEGAAAEHADADLAAALAEAAAEARARALRPEDLILAIKALEGEVAGSVARLTPGERARLRAWLVTVCIRAYYRAG